LNKPLHDFLSGKTDVLTRDGGPPITFSRAAPTPQPEFTHTIIHTGMPTKEDLLPDLRGPHYVEPAHIRTKKYSLFQ
jgi:hypothetical protein